MSGLRRVLVSHQDAGHQHFGGPPTSGHDDGLVVCGQRGGEGDAAGRLWGAGTATWRTVTRLTCRAVLGAAAILLDVNGGGEEEGPAHHTHKGTEHQRELQGAELPEERVRPPQGVRDLEEKTAAAEYCVRYTTEY